MYASWLCESKYLHTYSAVFLQVEITEASLYVPVQLMFPFLGPLIRKVAEVFPDQRFNNAMEVCECVHRIIYPFESRGLFVSHPQL